LAKETPDAAAGSSYGFVQIRPKQMEGKTEIHFTHGIVIRFSGPVDARYFKELVG
jgi:hypothetical protein